MTQPNRMPQPGLKPKDLAGIPWRIAFALQDRGWWLRQDIIWSKPNPMPESVTDRCTKAHEYLFLLSKSERYWFDQAAIAEAAIGTDPGDIDGGPQRLADGQNANEGRNYRHGNGPDDWDRLNSRQDTLHRKAPRSGNKARKPGADRGLPGAPTDGTSNGAVASGVPWEGFMRNRRSVWTVTTQPFSEAHFATFPPALIEPCILAGCPEGGTVLDPFGGAGTTGLVADRLKRNAILIELNPDYAQMAERRIRNDAPLLVSVDLDNHQGKMALPLEGLDDMQTS